jgi:hypothetical protein
MLLLGSLPWWILALVAAGGPRRAWSTFRAKLRAGDRDLRLLAWWFLLPLAIFSLAQSRLQLYVLPLFVPLSLMLARALANWPWLGRRRLIVTAVATAVALIGLKGVAAYWPADRDARVMASAIREIIEPYDIDEIVFVDMRGFHGLQLYLGVHIESVRTGTRPMAPSRFVAEEDLCEEIVEHEHNIYALKESHSCSANARGRIADIRSGQPAGPGRLATFRCRGRAVGGDPFRGVVPGLSDCGQWRPRRGDPRPSILIGQHTLAGLISCRLPATQEHAILGMSLKTIEPRQVRPKPPRQRAA